MMKRLSLILILLSLAVVQQVHAQYYSVNYDARTVAAMATAFGTEAVAESYYREQVDDILKHYNAAEVATAGIFASKFLEHKAFSDLGIWNSSTEKLLLPPHLPHGLGENHAEDMGGGETDAPLASNGYLLGQLPDENLRRDEKSVYAVRECGDEQHAGLFGHRVSGNQPKHRPSAETLGSGRHRLATYVGRSRQRAG